MEPPDNPNPASSQPNRLKHVIPTRGLNNPEFGNEEVYDGLLCVRRNAMHCGEGNLPAYMNSGFGAIQ